MGHIGRVKGRPEHGAMQGRSPANGRTGGLAENRELATLLREFAEILHQQGEDGFRVPAYRRAAGVIEGLDEPLRGVLERGGRKALEALPRIGTGIAAALEEMLTTGRWRQLERVKGEASPEALLRTLPGVGRALAARLAGEAGIESLEELEQALVFGEPDVGFLGPRRREALHAVLAERLGRRLGRPWPAPQEVPPVAIVLEADALYRARAEAGALRKIAPKRFNPSGEAWLPVMHARHEQWHFTLLFSNTELAHRLHRTDDWVVAYFQKDTGPEGRCTLVTETRGPLAGRRVIRGRERECARYYEGMPA
jgi:hypothetical protein